ncbi:hypothetical protein EVAR_72832_1 [Eumeta japonica]|uniref:Uncharacterized protein n=1 Tax=Eumeta variegata TaxID=151549 RepID=A0A4C1TK66_EUMVA|nr:hypothetical protein EVAR_72832_1 [Eumeta japonica]
MDSDIHSWLTSNDTNFHGASLAHEQIKAKCELETWAHRIHSTARITRPGWFYWKGSDECGTKEWLRFCKAKLSRIMEDVTGYHQGTS